jgi:hypothetical protein
MDVLHRRKTMNHEERLRRLLHTVAEEKIPNVMNPWPQLRHRLVTPHRSLRNGRHSIRRTLLLSGSALVLCAALLLLAASVSPATARTLAAIEQAIVGTRSVPNNPVSFQPAPPFIVFQPAVLPQGFSRIGERYNPNGMSDSQIGTVIPADGARSALVRARSQTPHVVIGYESTNTTYVALFQRAVQPQEVLPSGEVRTVNNQPATLRHDGTTRTLTWMQDNTWLELETDLEERELLAFATQLTITQRPDTTTAVSDGPAIVSYDLPLVSVEDALRVLPAQVPQPTWLPADVIVQGARVDPPDWLNLVYTRAGTNKDGGMSFEISRGSRSATTSLNGAETEVVQVNGQTAVYQRTVSGSAQRLAWEVDGYSYELSESRLGLTRDELLRVAESIR